MATMKACCPACQSRSIQRIKYFNISSNIAYQYRTSVDKGICTTCGSFWSFRSVVPHLVSNVASQASYQ
jgi:C4-type Zn-finger protein